MGCSTVSQPSRQITFHTSPNDTSLQVYMATDPQEWEMGLGSVASLGSDQGMYFVFPNLQARTIWMKGMHYPIDIIWVKQGMVVGVTAQVQPEAAGVPTADYTLYSPPEPITAVVEASAGYAQAHGITAGTALDVIR